MAFCFSGPPRNPAVRVQKPNGVLLAWAGDLQAEGVVVAISRAPGVVAALSVLSFLAGSL